MGNILEGTRIVIPTSETTPDMNHDPRFPEQYGFEEQGLQRKERRMIATRAELISSKVPKQYRDFCAHKYIQFKACSRSVYPFVYKCAHERHEWEECMKEDYDISRKEYEREHRLLVRKQRKEYMEKLKEERRQMVEGAGEAEH